MKAIDRLYQVISDVDNDALKSRLMHIAELIEEEINREAESRKTLANELVSAYMAFIDNDSRRKSNTFRAMWTRRLLRDEHWNGSYQDARDFIDTLDLFIETKSQGD